MALSDRSSESKKLFHTDTPHVEIVSI